MEEKNKIEDNKKTADNENVILREIINGRIFIRIFQKHLVYILFVFFLAICYMGYHYTFENTFRENSKLDDEIKLLRTEHIDKVRKLLKMSTNAEVLKRIKEKNLTIQESKEPFIRIKTEE